MPSLLDQRLEALREQFARVAARALQAAERAVRVAIEVKPGLARKVLRADDRINTDEVALERAALNFLAMQHPAATDLRMVATIIKANGDVERVGDCAVNIVAATRPLVEERADLDIPPVDVPPTMKELGDLAVAQLAQAIAAFNVGDADSARRVLGGEAAVDAMYVQVLQAVMNRLPDDARAHAHCVRQDIALLMIAKNLERIGDHATNIAENVLYVETGEIHRHRPEARRGAE
jgi:phosphate transport system protein